jgi:hypothetical protein
MHLPLPLNEPGPLLAYLEKINSLKPDLYALAVAAIRRVLQTDDGAILLDLLDKSVLFGLTPVLSDVRALAARNAQAFISSDLKRILGNESDQLLERQGGPRSSGHRLGRSGPRDRIDPLA